MRCVCQGGRSYPLLLRCCNCRRCCIVYGSTGVLSDSHREGGSGSSRASAMEAMEAEEAYAAAAVPQPPHQHIPQQQGQAKREQLQEQHQHEQQQQEHVALLRQRAAARQERLLARQAQRMRIVHGVETAAATSSSSNSTNPSRSKEGPQEVSPGAPSLIPEPADGLHAAATSSSSSSSSTGISTSKLKQRVDLSAVCLGIGAAVNTMLREEASPRRLFEALGFPYGPASWTVLCWVCGVLLYLPLPLLLLLSLAEQLSEHSSSSISKLERLFWAATKLFSPSPQADDSQARRPGLLRLSSAAAANTAVAAQPHLVRLSVFIVSFCCTITLLRVVAAAAGCCQ